MQDLFRCATTLLFGISIWASMHLVTEPKRLTEFLTSEHVRVCIRTDRDEVDVAWPGRGSTLARRFHLETLEVLHV